MRSMIARRGGPPSRTVSPPLRGHRGARGDAPDPLNRSGDPQSPNMNTAWSVPNGAKSALGTIYEEAGAGAGAGAEAGTKAWTMTIEATDGHGNNNVDNDDDTNNTMATTATTKQQRQKWQYNGNNNEEATTIAKQQWKRQQRTTTTQQRHGAATAAHRPQRQRRQLQQLQQLQQLRHQHYPHLRAPSAHGTTTASPSLRRGQDGITTPTSAAQFS